MNLFELFTQPAPRQILPEGGNLNIGDAAKGETVHAADEIDLKVHKRSFIIPILSKLLQDINDAFEAQYQVPIWSQQLLASKQFLGGSSLHFFNTQGISDQQFASKKPKVGDIDTQCNKELEAHIKEFLTNYTHKNIGDTTLLGFSSGNEQYNALFEFQNPPIKIQIDFEFGRYNPETNEPDDWFKFSHSSDWADIAAGVKGVFHKYIFRALSGITAQTAYIAKLAGRGKDRAIQISSEPEEVNMVSFAVASKLGGGVSQKYKPYIDPETGKPMMHNKLPVLELIESADRYYEQDLKKQFQMFFGTKPTTSDSVLQQSFLGTLALINKYVSTDKKAGIVEDFLQICFDPGTAQMITRDDPQRDAQIKFMAVDAMLAKLNLKNLRTRAVQLAQTYEDNFRAVAEYKKQNPGVKNPRAAMIKAASLAEATEPTVKAQLRKGMPHLHDLKALDFLDLLDEIHDGRGSFKLQNIPLNVKVDGFGGRFGKDAAGKPFMATSRTEPRYEPGFLKYHEEKGTTDPEVLNRAKLFDKLFHEMMQAVQMVDRKLGTDFLVNKQVVCEVLFMPFATLTPEGKLKFVGIAYDKLPDGVQLALVPIRVTTGDTGEDFPGSDKFIKQLLSLGRQGGVMFIDNSLTQNRALDVTEIINPLENLDQLRQIVSDTQGKRDRASLQLRREVEEKLQPVKVALEQAIVNDPNIIGKELLGKDYEGIVINSRLGPIKVTSQQQRDVISAKNTAKSVSPQGSQDKTAVVAIGSFVGHQGHQQLFDYTINKALAVGGDPYLFMGSAVGKNDPIPVADKVKTWRLLYPQYADNISAQTMEGGSLMQKIKHELINPTPGNPPRYDRIIIMVGEDQANMPIAQALMKAVNKFPGYEHVKVTLETTPRGTGMSFTRLRDAVANNSPQQAFQLWNSAFNDGKFGAEQLPQSWIRHLMKVTAQGMGKADNSTLGESEFSQDIQFHTQLNPTLWHNKKLRPAVADHLEKIAEEFERFLDVPDLDVTDITISGSNAAYTYTDHSDVDVHLVVKVPAAKQEMLRKYFDAKKAVFSQQHDITIHDQPVEMYVQFTDQPHTSAGLYSLADADWIDEPTPVRAHVDHADVRSKVLQYIHAIHSAIHKKDLPAIQRIRTRLVDYRKQGLNTAGEWGTANLVFKILRNHGILENLSKYQTELQDQELSIEETR